MTAQNRATLKAAFEDGDKPSGANFADFIDSGLNLTETASQAVAGDVTFSGLISIANMSLGAMTATSVAVSAAAFTGPVTMSALNVTSTSQVATLSGQVIATSTLAVAATATLNGGVRSSGAVAANIIQVNAAGSTQASATPLTGASMYTCVQATAGVNVGLILPASASGQSIAIWNAAGTAIQVYPFTGGTISNGSTNAAISVTASSAVMLRAFTDSAWFAWRAV